MSFKMVYAASAIEQQYINIFNYTTHLLNRIHYV